MSNITERKNFNVLIVGSALLAVNAGYLGALSLAGLHSATITHVTGNVAKTGIFFAEMRWFDFARMSLVLISFTIGSAISSIIVSGTKPFDLRRTYGWALLLESLLLWISYMVSNRESAVTGWWYSEYFGAMACGLQNALCTSYSGAMIRTTHMTGILTDIGVAIGQEIRIRYYKPIRARLRKQWHERPTRIPFTKRHNYINLNVNAAPTVSVTSHDAVNVAAADAATAVPTKRASVDTLDEVVLAPPQPTIPLKSSPTVPAEDWTETEPSILWRLKVLIPLFVGYVAGAMIGATVYLHIRNKALLVPSLFVGIVGFAYAVSTTLLKIRNKALEVLPDVDFDLAAIEIPLNRVFVQPAVKLKQAMRRNSSAGKLNNDAKEEPSGTGTRGTTGTPSGRPSSVHLSTDQVQRSSSTRL